MAAANIVNICHCPEDFLQCVSLRIHPIHMRVYKCEIDYRNKIPKKKKQT